MLRVYACVTGQHDLRLVIVAALICILSCATALSLAGRARKDSPMGRKNWLWAAAVVAGSGVWTTHFVAMLAFRPGLPIGYDPGLTILSIVLAILAVRAGLSLNFARLPEIGGAVTGLGIAAMHFTGMAAVEIQATPQWDLWAVAVAILIGVVLGAAAFRVSTGPGWRRAAGSVALLVVAICGLHFVAMSAVAFIPDPTLALPTNLVDPGWLALSVSAVTTLILGLGVMGSIVDRHLANRATLEAARLRQYVSELEGTRHDLQATTKHLETALQAAEAANLAKSQFLAAMSHELRTPLNAIIGFAEILKNGMFGPLGDAIYYEYSGNIGESGRHLLGMINQILELSKLDAGQLQFARNEVHIEDLVHHALAEAEAGAREGGLSIEIALEPDLPRLVADSARLEQMLGHLLSNAVKFTPAGGSIRVEAFRRSGDVCIAISDTGIGIAAADMPKVFERFGQADSSLARRYEGAGLGLPTAKRLIELQGGKLEFESTVGVGTTARIVLPRQLVIGERQAA